MLIQSDFHDYYDSIIAWGVDKTVVFNRKSQSLEEDGELLQNPSKKHRKSLMPSAETMTIKSIGPHVQISFKKLIIGFCGKLYPVVSCSVGYIWPGQVNPFKDNPCFYDAKSFIEFIHANKIVTKNEKGYSPYDSTGLYFSEAENIEKFFSFDWNFLEPLFRKYAAPTFIIGRGASNEFFEHSVSIIVNPVLKDFKFGKIIKAEQAFQQIHQYISGVLGVSTKETVEIDDKYKQQQHGHDDKYSFRKPPGKRGNPKWR